MRMERSDYIDVEEHAKALGCNVPTLLAVLPNNFEKAHSKGELYYECDFVSTLRRMWREAGLAETPVEKKENEILFQLTEGLAEDISLLIYMSALWLSQNPLLVQLAVGIAANCITDRFQGIQEPSKVNFQIVTKTKNGKSWMVSYKGPLEGLPNVDFPEIVRALGDQ